MRLARFERDGRLYPALVVDDGLRDLSGAVADLDLSQPDLLERIAALDPRDCPLVGGAPRLGPPIANISKIVGVGLNYRDHAEESGMPIPDEPPLFMKAVSAISGPNDPIRLPPGSIKTDWEVELGIVIGTTARHVGEAESLGHVAGYLIVHDVSERSYQLERGGTWDKGKGCDSFAPLGPWLVTRDEVPDPQNLDLWLDVNGEPRQRGTTDNMIFSCAFLVSYVSRFMTLLPGDVIATGTPAGVGLGLTPPTYLRAGDEVRLGVEGLGEQSQVVVG